MTKIINVILAIALVVCTGYSTECIEDNQSQSSTLGVYYWDVTDQTTLVADLLTEICGDGGYVECVSVYTKEGYQGVPILASLQFSCSNGYVSQIHGNKNVVGVPECANGGITGAYGTSTFSAVTDGGINGYDSFGNEKTISTWGEGYEFSSGLNDYENDGYNEISCSNGRYAIGFEFMYPDSSLDDSFDGDISQLWGFRMICSDEDTCPQDGLALNGSNEINDDDDRDVMDENDDDLGTDSDDSYDVTSGTYSIYNRKVGILSLSVLVSNMIVFFL